MTLASFSQMPGLQLCSIAPSSCSVWGLKPGLRACSASTLSAKLLPQPVFSSTSKIGDAVTLPKDTGAKLKASLSWERTG